MLFLGILSWKGTCFSDGGFIFKCGGGGCTMKGHDFYGGGGEGGVEKNRWIGGGGHHLQTFDSL